MSNLNTLTKIRSEKGDDITCVTDRHGYEHITMQARRPGTTKLELAADVPNIEETQEMRGLGEWATANWEKARYAK